MSQSRTDEELMQAYQSGEIAAFNELYARYSGRVYAYVGSRVFNRNEIDDLFQAVFLKLHKSRGLYNAKFLFAPWLFTICRTSLLDFFKSKKPEVRIDADAELVAKSPDVEAALSVTENIENLSAQQKKALEMRYGDGLEFSEIAERLQLSTGNVRQIISRTLRKLRGKV